ncbi:MAG TPA: hypothetical protein VF170_20570 [Planctomycetaceae bacterium]
MKRSVRYSLVAIVASAVMFSADVAWACPMCKAAAESDPRLPNAFLASILFMLGMPFALATCFGVAFYRLSKRMPAADRPASGEPATPSDPA